MPSKLSSVLDSRSLDSHFQPIVSVKKKWNMGAEAFARARQGSLPFEPLQLFQWAQQEGRLRELDVLCRQSALQGFGEIAKSDPDLMLFLNVEVPALELGMLGSDVLVELAREKGIKPENVVIELNSASSAAWADLQGFVLHQKSHGFLIAVEDTGRGQSDTQGIASLKPDILKLGRPMVQGLHSDPVRQELFKSMASLAHEIGALALASGVETDSEVGCCMGLGADLFQGFYFSRPLPPEAWSPGSVRAVIENCASRNRATIVRDMQRGREESARHLGILKGLLEKLTGSPHDAFDRTLSGSVLRDRGVECLYVLDSLGRQVTRTVTMQHMRGRMRGPLFRPALMGADHSMKDYYYGLEAGAEVFVTQPYVSMASGNLGRTLSCAFVGAMGKKYVLCMDVREG